MPIYLYRHPNTNEIREVLQPMNSEHRYFDENKVEWLREFTIPTSSVDTKIDPFNKNSFLDQTKNKRDTLGDLWDKSAELSEKRAKIMGRDEVKEKNMSAYEKKCKGKKHPGRIKKKDIYHV